MTPRRARRRPILDRILGAWVEQPAPRRALPTAPRHGRVDLVWPVALRESLR